MTIFLDMDGVCCDFVGAALRVHGFIDEEVFNIWPGGEYSMEKVLGLETWEFWSKIEWEGEEFWVNLEETIWFEELYDTCLFVANKHKTEVVFLSTPTLSKYSLSGKLLWLQKRFGKDFREYCFTPHKHLLAAPNHVLIDDSDKNVDGFIYARGCGILVPQQWNRNYIFSDRMEIIKEQLYSIMENQ